MIPNEGQLFGWETILGRICLSASLGTNLPSNLGYKRLPDTGVRKTQFTSPVSIFAPRYFPLEQIQGRTCSFDWDAIPREIKIVVVVGQRSRTESADDRNQEIQIVRDTAMYIRSAIDAFREAFDLTLLDRGMTVELTGYDRGGAISAAAILTLFSWADQTRCNLRCTTFDAPGIHPCHLNEPLLNKDIWEARVTNFVADPNPVNMQHRHLGRIIHVRSRVPPLTNRRWLIRCLVLDTLRVLAWMVLIPDFLCRWIRPRFLQWLIRWLIRRLRQSVPLLAVVAILKSVSDIPRRREINVTKLLEASVGKNREEIENSHSLIDLLQRLGSHTRGSLDVIEMESWPRIDALVSVSLLDRLWSLLQILVPYGLRNTGVRYWNDRSELIQTRMRMLKGYQTKQRRQLL